MKPFQSKILQIPCKGLVYIFFQGRKPKKVGVNGSELVGGGGGSLFALSKSTVQTPTCHEDILLLVFFISCFFFLSLKERTNRMYPYV